MTRRNWTFLYKKKSVSGDNGSYIDKVQSRKTLYIECMRHNGN